ncbi:VapE family protein [Sphingomonas sp. AR_OL41]|uniref:VapE domain-containing protein n=1 Tax=Sphingomonas sp. AR_OL41 TaxID=3042729 RepID=UPI0024801697|nr:VapE domain-containing protein [Sphingomonas sp. AR_OL41]MDH7975713.1 VapE family protein [Sphingomonas sp. AR_OL41]
MECTELLNLRLQDYRRRLATDEVIDPAEPFLDLDWSRDNRTYFADLVRSKICTKKAVAEEIAKARQRSIVDQKLGDVPTNVREYARLYSVNLGVSITYKGIIRIPGRDCATILDYTRGARLTALELGLPFSREAVNDAIEEHYADARDRALDSIRAATESRESFDWLTLAAGCFDARSTSHEFVVAVLKKFVWQVKRKLHGLPVTHHLMPVLFGAQGSGKSWFLRALCAPLAEVTSFSDFGAIGDDRNIDLWRSYIIVMDEMAKAGKADIEVTKHVITAENLERRPMRTTSTVTIRQCATMIGASNMSLVELIRDETGNRRFVELAWGNPPHGFVDGFDFGSAWRSVHHTDADPMADYMDDLAAAQSQSRNHGPVESWLLDLDENHWGELHDRADHTGFIGTQALFDFYLSHRESVNGGSEREHRSRNTFANELGRITLLADFGIRKHRTASANGWQITRPVERSLATRPSLVSIGGGRAR